MGNQSTVSYDAEIVDWSNVEERVLQELSHETEHTPTSLKLSDLPPEKIKELNKVMNDWIHGWFSKITNAFEGENLDIIKANMNPTNKILYRVEKLKHTASGLSIGDTVTFNDDLKSFSKDIDGIKSFISQNLFSSYNELVIFRTHGKNNVFDIKQLSTTNDWSGEHEVFVENKKWKVDKISTLSGGPSIELEDGSKIKLFDRFYVKPLVIDISPQE